MLYKLNTQSTLEKYTSRMKNKEILHTIVATDVVIVTLRENVLYARVMNVHRLPHYNNQFGFPGGLIGSTETADDAVKRLVKEKASLHEKSLYSEQLMTFSEINRDKRGRVVAIAYLALVPWENLEMKEMISSEELAWVPVTKLKNMAYDHTSMLRIALERLASRSTYTTIIAKLMPDEFTLTSLEQAFEVVTGKPLDKRNFRKKIEKLGIIRYTNKKTTGNKHRPAKLYEFKSDKVLTLEIL